MFQKLWICKTFGKRKESLLPNADSFLMSFIDFEWGRILETTVYNQELKCKLLSRSHYFFVTTYVLSIVIRRQFFKKPAISVEIIGYF